MKVAGEREGGREREREGGRERERERERKRKIGRKRNIGETRICLLSSLMLKSSLLRVDDAEHGLALWEASCWSTFRPDAQPKAGRKDVLL